ncbi:MAG: PQQ-binding-like beta-propeller repeat protein [bacterium]|nr:PQQ-binding-like beta-propeller repeat protein [bacterium]
MLEGRSSALSVGWKRAIGPGYSSLAIDDNRVFAMFSAGRVDVLGAFDVESGDELWRYPIEGRYAGHDGSHDGPLSTPFARDGRVYGLGAAGRLFALEARSGREIWATHLVDDHGARNPYYGFTTSPLIAEGVLIVQVGAAGKAIAGFDPADGSLLWATGDDTIDYHSPIVATLGERRQVVASGRRTIRGLDPRTGAVLWTHEHGGDDLALGGRTIVPLPAGDDRLFLMNELDSSVMLRVTRKRKGYRTKQLWSGPALRSSYVTPVARDGLIYGMNNRIFTCVDAATGEIVWRSRRPGDGFPTLVGDRLAIVTKPGTLHVAQTGRGGYVELARIDLFDEHSWSEVAFADGHLFARSMEHVARVDVGDPAAETGAAASWVAATEFGRFLARLERSDDRKTELDEFFAKQESFPIVEGSGIVHFVHRAAAEDVGIVGDMLGSRREDPMRRAPGTDLFHYSVRLAPEAAVTYGFLVDYADPQPDPLNPRRGKGLFGDVSFVALPGRRTPDLRPPRDPSRWGRLEALQLQSAVLGERRNAWVYLPALYDLDDTRRFPVAYVHSGKDALEEGRMQGALDRLIGDSVEPIVAVFVEADPKNPGGDLGRLEPYSAMIATELVPAVDARYRTLATADARATVGAGRGANVALYGALAHPAVFGRVGCEGPALWASTVGPLIAPAAEQPPIVYFRWGTYALRSPHEAWDMADESRRIWSMLQAAGHDPVGGEVPEGVGWACWRGHLDELLSAVFPLQR